MQTETILKSLWLKSRLMIKAFIISILVLLLLIPASYVEHLIGEREARQREAVAEVSSKWATTQNISGPMVVLPYWEAEADSSGRRTRHQAYFLPDRLDIRSTVSPVEKYRGIYKVMLYTSASTVTGSFGKPDLRKLNLQEKDIIWNEAYLKMDISDTKGLNEELVVNWNGRPLALAPQVGTGGPEGEGLTAPLGLSGPADWNAARFETAVNLNGSQQLFFTPLGKNTTVQLQSSWPHPSFTGDILPQGSEVGKNGFSATWKSLAHKRNFPQQWKDGAYGQSPAGAARNLRTGNLASAAFGVDLFVPVNGYQKTMRSVKYSVLCILLTFAAFFLIETSNNKSVHPFHYGLIGLALVLFYTLLLSFSEYVGFNLSYAIASAATVGLIAWFVNGLLGSSRLTLMLTVVLVLLYTYVFTILQLQDYSLLLGSVGLFLTLAVIMNFSRRIQWGGAVSNEQ